MNFCILVPPLALAIWYPEVGKVAGIGGSFATMFVCYFLPIATNLSYKKSLITNPELVKSIMIGTTDLPDLN